MTRILIVDDDDPFRRMLRLTLEKLGYAIAEARNGREALAECAAAPLDAIVTDIIMPDMEGIEFIGELRHRGVTAKIIAMSGGGRVTPAGYLHIARAMGAAATLAKPFSADELLAALHELLGPGASPS